MYFTVLSLEIFLSYLSLLLYIITIVLTFL